MRFPLSEASVLGRTRLRFRYTNWRGEDHVYVVAPEGVEVGHYDAGGTHPADHPDAQLSVVLHAQVRSRDGELRPGRRTFLVAGLRDIELIEEDG